MVKLATNYENTLVALLFINSLIVTQSLKIPMLKKLFSMLTMLQRVFIQNVYIVIIIEFKSNNNGFVSFVELKLYHRAPFKLEIITLLNKSKKNS